MKEYSIDEIREIAHQMRIDVIEMGHIAGNRGAHFGPALSSIEIMAALYFKVMNIDPKNPLWPERDRFVQSKGHACLSLYTALIGRGFIQRDLMKTFKQDESMLAGHPCRHPELGIEISTGSLGNGFAIASGMAMGLKLKKSSSHVFCLLGDGECNEGLVWEAAMNAVKYKLSNLIVIVDHNRVQLGGHTTDIMDIDLESMWKAVGWDVSVLEDGNDLKQLIETLEKMKNSNIEKPHAVIAKTTKGKGVSFMEGSIEWHARPIEEEQYEKAIKELKQA